MEPTRERVELVGGPQRTIECLEERTPVGVVAHAERDPLVVAALVDALWCHARIAVAIARRDASVELEVHRLIGSEARGRLELGDFDELALAGAVAVLERGLERDTC